MVTSLEDFVVSSSRLLEAELDAEIVQNECLLSSSLASLTALGHALSRVHLVDVRRAHGRSFVCTFARTDGRPLPQHRLTPGDSVRIAYNSTHDKAIGEAMVTRSSTENVVLSVKPSSPDDETPVEWDATNRTFAIVRSVNYVTHRRLLGCLRKLNDYKTWPGSHLVEYCFGHCSPPPPHPQSSHEFDLPTLNKSQNDALHFALDESRPLGFIHGPPGTGKTATVVRIIEHLVRKGKKVLLAAPSNIAVDNVLERCLHLSSLDGRLVRLGHPARTHEHTRHLTLEALLAGSEQMNLMDDARHELRSISNRSSNGSWRPRAEVRGDRRELREEVARRRDMALQQILDNASVIFSTLTASSASDYPLKCMRRRFDVVIIDECAQATELSCWLAMLQSPRCILVGDHRQLPPTLLSAANNNVSTDVTLMGRLHGQLAAHRGELFRLLQVQYRMNTQIMQWPSDSFYEGRLVADEGVANHQLSDIIASAEDGEEDVLGRLVLYDTSGLGDMSEVHDEESKGNVGEARVVAMHVGRLVGRGVAQKDIAVITPYSLQVKLIVHALRPSFPLVAVRTVDGFQGQEREAVILSLVRSNLHCTVGFLGDARRLNVAVTRARRHLCVVADGRTMGGCGVGHLLSLLQYMTPHTVHIVEDDLPHLDMDHLLTPSSDDKPSPRGKGKANKNKDKDRAPSTRLGEHDSKSGDHHMTRPSRERSADVRREEDWRAHVTLQLEGLVSNIDFPASLSPRQRAFIHELCDKMGLTHVTAETEDGRRFVGVAHRRDAPPPALPSTDCNQSLPTPQARIAPKPKPKHKKPPHKEASSSSRGLQDDDALLDAAIKAKDTCAMSGCSTSVRLIGESCLHCGRQHCLAHAQPEIHGCGQAARDAARRGTTGGNATEQRIKLINALHDKQRKHGVMKSKKK